MGISQIDKQIIEFKNNLTSSESRWKLKTLHFLFIVTIFENIWSDELKYWLFYNVGRNHKDWEWWWDGCYKFEFKNEEDKVKFILRWL